MYRVGREEVDAMAEVILSGELFRYHEGGQCERFERRYAELLGVRHVCMTASGTAALRAALIGLGIGPGDEVLVPACTYMSTAVAVLSVGAIPVIVDIDESLLLCPQAAEAAVGPHTRAMIPVHMWGLPCNMDALMDLAERRDLVVVEDACQAVGGAYEGRMLGSIGRAGAFSFNYYKNITCGEGGAVVTDDDDVAERARCAVDCCNFYWQGRSDDVRPFASAGARASELEGAMLNVQLDRLKPMIQAMREHKRHVLEQTADVGLEIVPSHSPDYECATHLMYRLPNAPAADRFAELVEGVVCGKTGRHVYTEWDPILEHRGAHHPALDPFNLPENEACRKEYSPDMCSRSLDILNRTVMVATHPDWGAEERSGVVERISAAAQQVC
ncbi:MAG: DegT/DnrJ/EryC1/StrS family aminotransferase [Candidatus Brocadiia bacterium]